LENYSNLDAWVATLNERIDAILRARLIHAIESWCRNFAGSDEDMPDGDQSQAATSRIEASVKPLIHEIRIRNQVIYLDPPLERARQEWLFQFQEALGE
jgi:dynein heavy chain 1